MATDGTPELAAKRCGEEFARLRTSRDWTRARLVARINIEIDEDDPNYDKISEAWLARLEDGRMVKIRRQTIEALCRALHCSARERARVLLAADRNVVQTDDVELNPPTEAINYISAVLAGAEEIFEDLIGQRRFKDLDEEELFEIAATALDLVRRNLRKRR